MKLLFITLGKINSIYDRGIYTDLLRIFHQEGHEIFIINPIERREKKRTFLKIENGVNILNVKTLNIQKVNIFEKLAATLMIDNQYLKAFKKFFQKEHFDLVLYSTPPIHITKIIEFVKNRNNALTYLLLKDIFPQNAVDLRMIKEGGFVHRLFRNKERRLYELTNIIGCMSDANVNYLLKNNPELNPDYVEVNPNTIEITANRPAITNRKLVREKYGIPPDAIVFVYGGNLGKPQGIDFLIETIRHTKIHEIFFLIVGDGTEFSKLSRFLKVEKPSNAMLIAQLPKARFEELLLASDVGLIFLSSCFTIPNFPSRLLSYLEFSLPVLAATDDVSDIGEIIEDTKCGYRVVSGNQKEMQNVLLKFMKRPDLLSMGENSFNLLRSQFQVRRSYDTIERRYIEFQLRK